MSNSISWHVIFTYKKHKCSYHWLQNEFLHYYVFLFCQISTKLQIWVSSGGFAEFNVKKTLAWLSHYSLKFLSYMTHITYLYSGRTTYSWMHSFNECTQCTLSWFLRTCFRNHLIHYNPLSFFPAFPRAAQSLLSMPWPTTFSVSQQLVAFMELDMSPSQTTLPTQRLWPLCRRMQPWLQHMADTQATRCHRPSLPRPSSCPSTMSTRHIDSEGQTTWNNNKVTLPVTERPPQHRNSVQSVPSYRNVTWTREHPKARKECRLKQIFRRKTDSETTTTWHLISVPPTGLSISWTQGNYCIWWA